MKPLKRVALVVVTLVGCIGCDQKTKSLARDALRERKTESFLADTIRLDYAENPGGFLELGAFLPAAWRMAVFTIGCSAGIAAIISYVILASQSSSLQILALSLICGGGIGNLIDRWTYGHVRDFLNIGLGPVRTGIFNLADVALMAGCFLFVWIHDLRKPPNRAP